MSINVIKDRSGSIRFTIKTDSSGNKSVYDKSGNIVGTIRNGMTYDKSGTVVATGEDIGALTIGN